MLRLNWQLTSSAGQLKISGPLHFPWNQHRSFLSCLLKQPAPLHPNNDRSRSSSSVRPRGKVPSLTFVQSGEFLCCTQNQPPPMLRLNWQLTSSAGQLKISGPLHFPWNQHRSFLSCLLKEPALLPPNSDRSRSSSSSVRPRGKVPSLIFVQSGEFLWCTQNQPPPMLRLNWQLTSELGQL